MTVQPDCVLDCVKPNANERQNTRNKKHETKRFSTSAVYRLRHPETKKKTLLDSRNMFSVEHVQNSQSTIYLKHMVVYMAFNMRCRSLTFRRCFVNRVRYPEKGHFEVQNRLDTSDSQNTV